VVALRGIVRGVKLPRVARSLYVQVLVGVCAGVAIGALRPEWGVACKPLGDGFIRLVKMVIAPIIFATVVVGIARMGDMKKVGRVGLKAIVYFEVLTTIALIIGLGVGRVVAPGAGMHADPRALDPHAVDAYAAAGKNVHGVQFLLNIIPSTVGEAFASGDILQVLLISVLVGVAVSALGPRVTRLTDVIDEIGQIFFKVVALVMRLAPIGALGAMAFTVGKYGLATLIPMGKLIAAFYVTSLLFVLVILGLVARWVGFGIWPFLRYIREELLIVLGTSSSESVLPRMMAKMESLGCRPSVVGLVMPMGYSFNLDGTSIYLTMATLFISQALDVPLPLGDQMMLLAILLITSKGAAAVTGGGFVTLAATLSATGRLPIAGLALLLGVDRFMSEARALTNLVGNGVATLAVARWEGELDLDRLQAELAGHRADGDSPSPDGGKAQVKADGDW
jgi:aerobic C4-dicarboxylate transport protein